MKFSDPNIADAWFAGFFEGEGHVRLFFDGRQKKRIVGLAATQVNLEPIQLLKEMYSGQILRRIRKNCQPCHEWRLHGTKAVALARRIHPLLSSKRQAQIDPLLHWQDGRLLPNKRGANGQFILGARG